MLGALIGAARDAEDDDMLVATLPVGGRTLLERQARLAAGAGATHIVALVERLPPPLTAAIDRLRRDGIAIDVARSAHDAADRFHPEERLLLFADGALTSAGSIAKLAAMPAPVLLTLGEDGPAGGFERIDAGARWSGVALIGGEMLRRTVAQLGDWDLNSTLLRRLAGSGARRLDVADGADLGMAEPAALVRTRASARAATAALLAPSRREEGWPARFVYLPLARRTIGLLFDRPIEAVWLRSGALALTFAAVVAAAFSWLEAALALLVLGGFVETLGRLLDAARLGRAAARDRLGLAREAGIAAASLGWALHDRPVASVTVAIAVATIAAMGAMQRERGSLARFAALTPPLGIADADAQVLLFALAAALGSAFWAPLAVLLYAVLSFGIVQHLLARSPAKTDLAAH